MQLLATSREIFGQLPVRKDVAYEWCSDFWDDFHERGGGVTDPTGPSRGEERVVRSYNAKNGKYDRSNEVD